MRLSGLERIAKVLRPVPTGAASLARWKQSETAQGEALGLSVALAAVVRDVVFLGAYLAHRRTAAQHAAVRTALDQVLKRATAKLDASTAWQSLSALGREALKWWPAATLAHFVQHSSCVEGRNGFLLLRFHHRPALLPALPEVLTVIHDFVLHGGDVSTAAERLFGILHADMFKHLLQVILLLLPRKRTG